jgi:hypothetical protein
MQTYFFSSLTSNVAMLRTAQGRGWEVMRFWGGTRKSLNAHLRPGFLANPRGEG